MIKFWKEQLGVSLFQVLSNVRILTETHAIHTSSLEVNDLRIHAKLHINLSTLNYMYRKCES